MFEKTLNLMVCFITGHSNTGLMDLQAIRKSAFPLGLALILLLIVGKNQLEKKYVRDLGDTMSTVIEDRLLVEGYIYDLSNLLHHKQQLLSHCEPAEGMALSGEIRRCDDVIGQVLTEYARTRLTDAESLHFTHLQFTLDKITGLEQYLLLPEAAGSIQAAIRKDLEGQYLQAGSDLNALSAIQLAEGRSEHARSRRIVAGSSMLSHMEMILLIALGMMMQALLRRFRTVPAKLIRRPEWN
jgi:hypothetical protein